jgi:hypothetical protein
MSPPDDSLTPGYRVRRIALVCVIAITTLNLWTGGPLLAVWVGSRVQGSGPPDMAAIGVVALTLGVVSYVLVRALARLDAVYGRLAGRQSTVSRHVPWLRSMRGERPHDENQHARELSPLEVILIASVVLVIVLFEVWFFFYSGSSIDQQSGRSHKAPLIGAVVPRAGTDRGVITAQPAPQPLALAP